MRYLACCAAAALVAAPAPAFQSGAGAGAGADLSCPPQPLPPAIDSIGAPRIPAADIITFAATPGQHPGRAWVVRLSRRGRVEAKIEIVRLRRLSSCNRYTVENRWEAPITTAQYSAVAEAVAPWSIPASDTFSSDDPGRESGEIVLDGTGLELRVQSTGWLVTRTLNHAGQGGPGLSAIFHALVSRHIPQSDLPGEGWQAPRGS